MNYLLLTNEKIAASMAPRCTLTYLLLCKIGFWYQGIFTDFIERDFCECKFDNDLQNEYFLYKYNVQVHVCLLIMELPASRMN